MYDFGLSVLEQYELDAKTSYRGRGALIVDTQNGLKIIKEWKGSEKRLKLQREVQLHIRENSNQFVDCVLENREGALAASDQDGILYTVRDWCAGRECDVKSKEDIIASVQMLAQIHTVMQIPMEETYRKESLTTECRRHNREIRKISSYLYKKRRKNEFERCLLACMERFWEQGERTVEKLEVSSAQQLYERAVCLGSICHGDCNHHNVIFSDKGVFLVNYDNWTVDCQMADLFLLMRKVLEKNNWNIRLGQDMVMAYHKVRPLEKEEIENLHLRLAYPWKFWKLVNHYDGRSKTWMMVRNMEKLTTLLRQEKAWLEFTKEFTI